VLSLYPIDPAKPCKGFGENTLGINTEVDRCATTLHSPSERDDSGLMDKRGRVLEAPCPSFAAAMLQR
jgi:hypothetical protein